MFGINDFFVLEAKVLKEIIDKQNVIKRGLINDSVKDYNGVDETIVNITKNHLADFLVDLVVEICMAI